LGDLLFAREVGPVGHEFTPRLLTNLRAPVGASVEVTLSLVED
jgi:hypothetical protein